MKHLFLLLIICFSLLTNAKSINIEIEYPLDKEEDIEDVSFCWYIPSIAEGLEVTYDIYFGTDKNPDLLVSGILDGWNVTNTDGIVVADAFTYQDSDGKSFIYFFDDRIDKSRLTTYYWKVIAKLSNGNSISSSVHQFTTKDWNNLPTKPQIIYPKHNATNISHKNLEISWNPSTDYDGDRTTYNVYLGTTYNNMDKIADNIEATNCMIQTELADQEKYLFYIEAIDGYTQETTISQKFYFTVENYLNDAPEKALLYYPYNKTANVGCDVNLSWGKPLDKDNDMLSYDIYMDDNPNPSTKIASDISDTSYKLNLKQRHTKYYWKIITKDKKGGESESEVFTFIPWVKPKQHIEMVKVEGGVFSMGQPNPNLQYSNDEQPVHPVELDDYLVGKYEVTWAQFCDFLNALKGEIYIDYTNKEYHGCNVVKSSYRLKKYNGEPLCLISKEKEVVNAYEFPKIYFSNNAFHVKPGFENYPASNMNHHASKLFCEWMGGRLLTEAEWEYAAKGGNKSKGYTYSGSNNINEVGYYSDNSENPYNPMVPPYMPVSTSNHGTFEVGNKLPNELGVYDMTGNVRELVSDWYAPYEYSVTPVKNPKGPSTKPTTNPRFIYRGGSWNDYVSDSRNCRRYTLQYAHEYNFKYFWGFRFAKDVAKNASPVKANLILPSNNTVNVKKSTQLQWEDFKDPENDLVAYDVFIGTSENNLIRVARNTQCNSFIYNKIDNNTTYFWKVIAKDTHGNTTQSDVWQFTSSIVNKYTVSGKIVTKHGTPLSNVELIGFDQKVVTNSSGEFITKVNAGWTGKISPFKHYYSFSNESTDLTNISSNTSKINFTATYVYTHYVYVDIKDENNNRVQNINISTTSNKEKFYYTRGIYYSSVEDGWTSTVTPVLKGYQFTPSSQQVNILEEDIPLKYKAKYVGTQNIRGKITDDQGNPLKGVVLSGFSNEVVTDANGNYTTTETVGWSGTIKPEFQGSVFYPESFEIQSINSDMNQDFKSLKTFTIEMKVVDGINPIPNAVLTIQNNNYYSDVNGLILISDIKAGDYPYTISAQNYNTYNSNITIKNQNIKAEVELSVSTDIDDVKTGDIAVYPNPTQGMVTIQSGISKINNIKILNTVGQRLTVAYSSLNTSRKTINLKDFEKGVLIVIVETGNDTFVRKIVKQ